MPGAEGIPEALRGLAELMQQGCQPLPAPSPLLASDQLTERPPSWPQHVLTRMRSTFLINIMLEVLAVIVKPGLVKWLHMRL